MAHAKTQNFDKFFQDNPDWLPYADLVIMPPLPEELMREYTDVSPEVLARCGEFVWEGGGHVSRGAIYVRVRRELAKDKKNHADRRGGDRWAAMLCLQAPPGVQTTDSFWAGRKSWVQVFGEDYANRVRQGLAARGINLKPGDEYMPELVRPGYGPKNPDPEAIVPFGGARSYIKRLCEQRGWAVEGAVNVKHREPDSDPHKKVKMATDLVRQKAKLLVDKNPSLKRLNRKDLHAEAVAKFGPSS